MAGVIGDFESSAEEMFALGVAIEHNCDCQHDPEKLCPAHAMLRNPDVIKHMLFMRRLAHNLMSEEWRAKKT